MLIIVFVVVQDGSWPDIWEDKEQRQETASFVLSFSVDSEITTYRY